MKIEMRPLAVASALLLLFGLVGLLVIDDDAGSTRLTAAAAATTEQGTARMSMTISIDGTGTKTTMAGDGLVDFGATRARMAFTSPLLPGPMEVVVDGTTAYVRASLPQFQAVAGGKPWVAIDTSASTPGSDFFGAGSDPLQSLRMLQAKGIASNVRENGTQEVRGVPTTRYVADVDVAEMLKAVDSPQAKAMAGLVRDADAEMEVWLSDDKVVRRSVFRMTFGIAGQSISSTVTTELFEFGVAADGLEPPPAEQVHRLS